MELKYWQNGIFFEASFCSNRTFMELKFTTPPAKPSGDCSNRTFMELKFLSIPRCTPRKWVLIVPLWN